MSVDILIFSNMNVARVLFCRKTKPFFDRVVGQEDNDSEELTEEPWNYARGDTLEDTKWHQLKIGSLKYFSTLKSDRYETRPWRGEKGNPSDWEGDEKCVIELGIALEKKYGRKRAINWCSYWADQWSLILYRLWGHGVMKDLVDMI